MPDEIAVPDQLAELLRIPFDPLLTDPTRLRIEAALIGLPAGGSMRFTALARALQLSDGNLGTHLAQLVEHGYVEAEATLHGKRRTTWYSATLRGRQAFDDHVAALRAVVGTTHRE